MNNSIGGVKNRRARTLQRLENQLESGVKQTKGNFMSMDKVDLTEQDITRINKEIAVLKTKI